MTLEERIAACDSFESAKYLITETKDTVEDLEIEIASLRAEISSKSRSLNSLVTKSKNLANLMHDKTKALASV